MTAPPATTPPVATANAALALMGEKFLSRYEGLRGRLIGSAFIREEASEIFRARGLPTPREEAWHFTSLRPLADIAFHEPLTEIGACERLMDRLPAIEGPRLVFVDGRFRDDLSIVPDAVSVRVGGPAYGPLARAPEDRLAALNTMLAEDGAAIEVAEGRAGGTLMLVSLGAAPDGRAVAFHPRHFVRLARGASLTLIEVAVGENVYLHNPVIEALVGEDATLVHLRLQDEAPGAFHLSTVYADIATRGTYDSFALTLGARLARMEVHARLGGAGAAAHLNAAQLLGGSQHADFTTIVSHDAPNCASRQTVKNVLTGRSRGVFQGRIEVARAAQKTDGYQMNQALLLSPDAEIDSKPQLEIYADDVKCSHGATVGELDADQLFYLRSRGIAEADARAMLVRAFLAEALDPIAHEPTRAAMEHAIEAWWMRHSA
jgi:Fe-S cluster assembly protein SufD